VVEIFCGLRPEQQEQEKAKEQEQEQQTSKSKVIAQRWDEL